MVVTFLAAIVLDILLRLVQYHKLGSEAALHDDDISRWKIITREGFWERILRMDMVAILVAALRFILAPSEDKLVTCIRYLYLVLEGGWVCSQTM
jgi:hypothetical protein